MKTVTIQELFDYINNQPEDRKVDLCDFQNTEGFDVGCVMVHYGKDHGFNFDRTSTKLGWREPESSEFSVGMEQLPTDSWFGIFDWEKITPYNPPKTYGALKKLIKPYYVNMFTKPKVLKIYTQDHGWAGVIIVTATSVEEAHKIMEEKYSYPGNYDPKVEIEENEIDGFTYENRGDT